MKHCRYLLLWLFFIPAFAAMQAQALSTTPPSTDTIAPDTKQQPSDWDIAVEAVQLSKDAAFMRDSIERQGAVYTNKRNALQEEIKAAETDSTTDAEKIKMLRADLKSTQKAEKETEKNLKRARTIAEFAESVANMESKQQRQQLPKSRKQVQQLRNIFSPPPPEPKVEKKEPAVDTLAKIEVPAPVAADSAAVAAPTKTEETDKKRSKPKNTPEPKPLVRSYSAAEDVLINPPAKPCALAPEIRDEFSGEVRRETLPKELFRYTNQALRKVYGPEKPHTIAEVSLISNGANAALHLTLRINDPGVRRTQGSLQKGGTATLKFMDGYSIILNNSRADEGVTEPDGQVVVFQGNFPIDRATIKKMRTVELDRLRLAWTNGYEDYDVQQVDLLMWQSKCLFEQ